MAKQTINRGTAPNDNTGDTLRDGAAKINSNFQEVYDNLGDGTTLSFNVSTYTTSTETLENKTIHSSNNTLVINMGDLDNVSIPVPATDAQILEYNYALSKWIVTDRVGRHLVPNANSVFDLGSPEYKFRDLYLSGNTLHLGDLKLSSNNGEFKVESETNPSTGGFKLSGLVDVSVDNPANTQVLTWNSSANTWYAANAAGGSTIDSLNDVSDVVTSGTMNSIDHTPSDGQVLGWNSGMSHWMPIDIVGPNTANADYVTLTGTQVLTNKTIYSANNALILGIDTLSDVITSGANAPINGQILTWSSASSVWTPSNTAAYDSTNNQYDFGSNKILYSNYVATESDLSSYSPATYHGMVMHVHATGAAYYAHSGAWRKLITDTSYGDPVGAGYTDPLAPVAYSGNIASLVDVSTNPASEGQVLKWTSGVWTPAADNAGSGGSGIALTDLSVSKTDAGTANLVYNSTTGVFTYTPPDLSNLPTASLAPVAYSGNIASLVDVSTNPATEGQVLKWVSGIWTPASDLTSSGGSGIGLTDLSVTTNSVGTASLSYNNSTGVFTYTPPNLSSYITSLSDLTTPKLGGNLDANTYNIDMGTNTITDAKVGNWDTSYGWGNHGSAGYQSSASLNGDIDTHLNQTNPTSGHVLSWNGSDYAWVANSGGGGISNVVEDTSPQLGGDLDTNGKNISYTFNVAVTSSPSNAYTFSDSGNVWFPSAVAHPTLYLRRGEIYNFVLTGASGHPFRIQNASNDVNLDATAAAGLTNNGAQTGTITFKVPMGAPSTLYYRCTVHSNMAGIINIV